MEEVQIYKVTAGGRIFLPAGASRLAKAGVAWGLSFTSIMRLLRDLSNFSKERTLPPACLAFEFLFPLFHG